MRKISIYLDDIRIPIEHPENKIWEIIRSYEDFVEVVELVGLDNIDIISLDHDLDPSATKHFLDEVLLTYQIDYSKIEEKTGLDVAKWLIMHSIDTGKKLPLCYVHSANPIGAANIEGHINLYLKKCRMPENCVRVRWKCVR